MTGITEQPPLETWYIINEHGQISTVDGWKYPWQLWPCLEINAIPDSSLAADYAKMADGFAVRASDLALTTRSKEDSRRGQPNSGTTSLPLPPGPVTANPYPRCPVCGMRVYGQSAISPPGPPDVGSKED